ncbi:TPA: cysteine--tRNA ligase [bacterium]|nr:cysteine--tRNA ligase [bacterium]
MKIYNSLTKREEEFIPLEDKHVKMYNCGPTVYDYFHIGNARNFVTAETIRRYLEYKGYRVTFIQNVTDIEDKIIKKANETGVEPSEVAEKFTKAYFEDTKNLGMLEPTHSPKATEHISEIVDFVQKLIDKGVAYEVDGDVYYDLSKFDGYGKLSGQKFEDTIAGARVEVNEKKRHPADFDLWKKAKPGEPAWDSPWGGGRPGWHIECSVMSSKYLGDTFDIHSGGNDLIFPHHENEIAQSEGLTGKPLARYWVHNGMLQTKGGKMSKSLGNIKSIRELLQKYSPDAIRLYLLSAHYRAPLELNDNSLDEASSAVERIKNCISLTKRLSSQNQIITDELNEREKKLNDSINKAVQKFEESMDDDFNTPGALGAIFELITSANKFASDNNQLSNNGKALLSKVNDTITRLCEVLGLNMKDESLITEDKSLVDDLIKLIIEIRQIAREKKDWAIADKIRDGLTNAGIKLEDTRDGTTWKISK